MPPRIIVLEDNASLRRLLTRLLERRGYQVVSAAEPLICPLYADLDARCSHEFPCGDFLLSDNRMPRMTGLQFVARQLERGCKGAVQNKAIVSAAWRTQDLETATRLGCKVFSKPYPLQEVFAWLAEGEKLIPPGRQLAALDGMV